jgi:predicted MFS family arabinose efflux permease
MGSPARRIIGAYREAFRGLPREVWLLSLAMFVNRAGTMVLPFLTLYLTRKLDFTTTEAGRLVGLYGVGSVLGSWSGGWLSDRIDPNRVQQLSLVAAGVGFLTVSQLESPRAWAIAMVVVGAVADTFRPALMAATARYSPPLARARAFALVRLATNLGMAIGPAVAGLLAMVRYVWLFVGEALTCWAAAVILFKRLGPVGADRPGAAEARDLTRSTPWRDPPFLYFLVLINLLGLAFFQVFGTMPLYLRGAYGLPEGAIGALLATNALIIALFEMVLLRSLERRRSLQLVAVGSLLVCVGISILPLGPPIAIAALSVVLWTVGEMLSLPVSTAFVAERADERSMGSYMGAYTVSFSVAFVVAPVLGTTIYERLSPEALWLGIGGLGIVLGLGFAVLARSLSRPQAPGPSGASSPDPTTTP